MKLDKQKKLAKERKREDKIKQKKNGGNEYEGIIVDLGKKKGDKSKSSED
jgi:hypothetical protein